MYKLLFNNDPFNFISVGEFRGKFTGVMYGALESNTLLLKKHQYKFVI